MFLTPAVKEAIYKLNEKGAFSFCQFCRRMAECCNSTAFHFIFSNKATQRFGKLWQNKKKSLGVNLAPPPQSCSFRGGAYGNGALELDFSFSSVSQLIYSTGWLFLDTLNLISMKILILWVLTPPWKQEKEQGYVVLLWNMRENSPCKLFTG